MHSCESIYLTRFKSTLAAELIGMFGSLFDNIATFVIFQSSNKEIQSKYRLSDVFFTDSGKLKNLFDVQVNYDIFNKRLHLQNKLPK